MPSGNNLVLWWVILPAIAAIYAAWRTWQDYKWDKKHRDDEGEDE